LWAVEKRRGCKAPFECKSSEQRLFLGAAFEPGWCESHQSCGMVRGTIVPSMPCDGIDLCAWESWGRERS
jgi:hypothetical protein